MTGPRSDRPGDPPLGLRRARVRRSVRAPPAAPAGGAAGHAALGSPAADGRGSSSTSAAARACRRGSGRSTRARSSESSRSPRCGRSQRPPPTPRTSPTSLRAAHATGLDEGSADIVTCSQSLQWMAPEPTLAEIARILRPGRGLCRIRVPLWLGCSRARRRRAAFREDVSRAEERTASGARTRPGAVRAGRSCASGWRNRQVPIHGRDDRPRPGARQCGQARRLRPQRGKHHDPARGGGHRERTSDSPGCARSQQPASAASRRRGTWVTA